MDYAPMPTTLLLTRDSVAAGDDVDGPHERKLALNQDVATPADLQALAAQIAPGYLPNVGETATWAAYSRLPLAIFSNRGTDPHLFWLPDSDLRQLAVRNAVISLHFVYLESIPAQTAREVIERTMSAYGTKEE